MNQKKIAKLLHVSPSTVSKALSGSSEISPETAEMIQQKAIEMGYFKEKSKRKRDYNKTMLIALIVPEVMGFHFSTIVTHIKNEIEARGGHVAVYISDFNSKKANDILKSIILRKTTDGIIMFDQPTLEVNPNVPIITIGDVIFDEYDSITYNTKKVIEDGVQFLINSGHKKIGFVGEPNTIGKADIFKEIIKEKGLDINDDFMYTVNNRFEAIGYEAVKKILLQKERPTALFAAYDEIAISLLNHLERNGIKVPEQISVMGINNISSSAHTKPSLTTVDIFMTEYCETIVSILFDKIINETSSVKHITMQHKIIVRESVKDLNIKEN